MVIGYASGVFDLFHIGHVNLLRNARAMCDKLIVGVSIDSLVAYKNKKAVIPYEERVEIVRACRYVDLVVPQETMDKVDAYKRYKFDLMFVGDDWFSTKKWDEIEATLNGFNVKILYFPYTKTTSSTLINGTLDNIRQSHNPSCHHYVQDKPRSP
jgi:glycerol-3-phosphate cytidylyltransferase|nr:adenylyltransferase/cytidyltransferase family protein [uncultured Albidiferax sp.]